MNYADINAFYTKTVAEWLAKGYTINSATMRGDQGEIAKIDMTDGNEIIRVMLTNFNDGYEQGVEVLVGRSTEENIKPNSSYTWDVIWPKNLEVISSEKFCLVIKNGERSWTAKK